MALKNRQLLVVCSVGTGAVEQSDPRRLGVLPSPFSFFCYTNTMKVGTDIIQISCIEKAIERHQKRFLARYLNDEEIALVKKTATAAGFWAAKEAIAKALGCGIGRSLSFHDIILHKDAKGAPSFSLSQQAQNTFNIQSHSLSISHDGGFAIAVVIIVL